MAALDGIDNKIHPGEPMDKNLYDPAPEEAANYSTYQIHLEVHWMRFLLIIVFLPERRPQRRLYPQLHS